MKATTACWWRSEAKEEAMEVEVFTYQAVQGEFSHPRAAFIDGPENWMPGVYESAVGKVTQLVAQTKVGELKRWAKVEVGPIEFVNDSEVAVPITWQSLEAPALFPVLKGKLRLFEVAKGRCGLKLEGSYEPVAGGLGEMVLGEVARATVSEFVERVSQILGRNGLGRAVAEQEAAWREARGEDLW